LRENVKRRDRENKRLTKALHEAEHQVASLRKEVSVFWIPQSAKLFAVGGIQTAGQSSEAGGTETAKGLALRW